MADRRGRMPLRRLRAPGYFSVFAGLASRPPMKAIDAAGEDHEDSRSRVARFHPAARTATTNAANPTAATSAASRVSRPVDLISPNMATAASRMITAPAETNGSTAAAGRGTAPREQRFGGNINRRQAPFQAGDVRADLITDSAGISSVVPGFQTRNAPAIISMAAEHGQQDPPQRPPIRRLLHEVADCLGVPWPVRGHDGERPVDLFAAIRPGRGDLHPDARPSGRAPARSPVG